MQSPVLIYTATQLTAFGNLELVDKLFIQFSFKQLYVKGNEFLTQRAGYGVINNFILTNYNLNDHITSGGILYNINKNVYANVQYNWWGKTLKIPPILISTTIDYYSFYP